MKSPVLFVIFLREDTTRKVFERIRGAKPPRLYVAADGPRPGRPDDIEKCKATRNIINEVDWDCEVKTLFREKNLGIRQVFRGFSLQDITYFRYVPVT